MPCPNTTQSATRSEAAQHERSDAKLPATRRWRVPPRQHAAATQVKKTPRPLAVRQAATNLLSSTGRCATLLVTPCTCSRQEERAMPLPRRHRAKDRRVSRPALCACVAIVIIRGAAPVAGRLHSRVSRPRSSALSSPVTFPLAHSLFALE